ncbi:hypothetical protein FQN57_002243 [Myotisia sp. PD_48]|nr:hypothetical protein FQN57_002243 [Myotisia sp. PD_48]
MSFHYGLSCGRTAHSNAYSTIVAFKVGHKRKPNHDNYALMSAFRNLGIDGKDHLEPLVNEEQGRPLTSTTSLPELKHHGPVVEWQPQAMGSVMDLPAYSSSASAASTTPSVSQNVPNHTTQNYRDPPRIEYSFEQLAQSEGEDGDDEFSDESDSGSVPSSEIDVDMTGLDEDAIGGSGGIILGYLGGNYGRGDGSNSSDGDSIICSDEGIETLGDDEDYAFIHFGHSVRFSPILETIPIPGWENKEAKRPPEMTCHERMLHLKEADTYRSGHPLDIHAVDPEEHTPETLDLDKQLLFAFINGLRTLPIDDCRAVLQSRVLHGDQIGIGEVAAPIRMNVNEYLGRIMELLLGVFPNLFDSHDYTCILSQVAKAISFDEEDRVIYGSGVALARGVIKKELEQKLGSKEMFLAEELLEWFSGELLEPLGRCASKRNV